MDTIKTLISTSDEKFDNELQWSFGRFVNGSSYMIDLNTESQNLNVGIGMLNNVNSTFYVEYPELLIKNKPIITELCDKSATQIDWANLYTNTATITGDYEYVNNFILKNNTSLNLHSNGLLQYNSTIPAGFTLQFMIKLSTNFNNIIFTTNDNTYQVGYDGSQQKFYTKINGTTNYSGLIKITENPFFISVVYNHIIIRQYNIYNMVKNITNLNVTNLNDLPVKFMVQENN